MAHHSLPRDYKPSWFGRVVDPGRLDGDMNEAIWMSRELDRGNADALLAVGVSGFRALDISDENARLSRGFILEAAAKRHPGASYALGRLCDPTGPHRGTDPHEAARLYLDGYTTTRHVGCAIGLLLLARGGFVSSASGPLGVTACEDRVVDLACAADFMKVAELTGSGSSAADTVFEALQIMRDRLLTVRDTRVLVALSDNIRHLLELGAGLGDIYMMADLAEALVRPSAGGFVVPVLKGGSPNEDRAMALCDAVLAKPQHPSNFTPQCKAASLIGSVAEANGDMDRARSFYIKSVRLAFKAGPGHSADVADPYALITVPRFLIEGIGGPRDADLADRVINLGVERGLGPSIELAAQRAAGKGEGDVAASLWQRAAAVGMPLAKSVVNGSSSSASLPGGISVALCSGGRTFPVDVAATSAMLRCSACGQIGRLNSSLSGASDASSSSSACVLNTCGRCKMALYCNRVCQKSHWPAHKPNCKVDGAEAAV